MEKKLLVASLIPIINFDSFLKNVYFTFKLTKEDVLTYEILNDYTKLLITFKIVIKEYEPPNFKQLLLPNTFPINKKGEAFYTINALNSLIDQMESSSIGNTDYKSVKIDWNKYQNSLILLSNKELTFLPIKRIFK
jgi:hypothetical protein